MSKRDFLRRVRDEAKVQASLEAIDQIVQGFCRVIQHETVYTHRCQVRGLGVFTLRKRAAKQARNPQTGETVTVPPRVVVAFKPSADFAQWAALANPADK